MTRYFCAAQAAVFVVLGVLCNGTFSTQAVAGAEPAGAETEIGKLAATMKPGTWAELKTKNYTKDLIRVKNHHIYQYTHDGQWDPRTEQFLFVGQGHYSMLNFIVYSAKTNTWKLMPTPDWYKIDPKLGRGPIGHAYDNNAIDIQRGILFHHQYHSPFVHRYDINKEKWLPPLELDVNRFGRGGHSSALVYFPEMGGLVRVRITGQVDFYDPKSEKWSFIDNQERPMGKLHPFVEYSPAHGIVIFGGGNGSNDVYRLDRDAKITSLKKPPFAGLNSTHRYVITVDPVSGEFLVIDNVNKGKFYAFNAMKNEWRLLAEKIPPQGFMVAAPVSNYGVVIVCTYRPEQVFLYKHAAVKKLD